MVFQCCTLIGHHSLIESEAAFDSHYKFHFTRDFAFSRKNEHFVCPISGCNTGLPNYYTIKRHFYRKHFDLISDVFTSSTLASFQNSQADSNVINNLNFDYDFDVDSSNGSSFSDLTDQPSLVGNVDLGFTILSEQTTDPPRSDFSEQLANFLIKCRADFKISELIISKLIISYNCLLLSTTTGSSSSIDKETILAVNSFVKSPYQIRKAVMKVKNATNLELFEIIKPQSGSATPARFEFFFCPLIDPITKLLNNQKLFRQLLLEHQRSVDPFVIRTLKDGSLYSQKEHNPQNFELNLKIFIDDLTLRQTGNQQYTVVCGSFNNLPLKYLAKRTDMFLIAIADRNQLNEIGLTKFFQPLFDEIDSINARNLKINQLNLHLEIGTTTGDNKGIHEVLAMDSGFQKDSCVKCPVYYSRLNDINLPFLDHFDPRPLNDLQVFKDRLNSPYNFPSDIFHIYSESGVIDRVLGPILKKYYFHDTQTLIENFNRFPANFWRHGKIKKISENDSKGYKLHANNGMQKVDFILKFPFLDDRIDRNSKDFQLISLLKELIQFHFCDTIGRVEQDSMHLKVMQFQKIYFEILKVPAYETFPMKLHYPCHFKDDIDHAGPLNAQSALIGERFLKLIKDSVECSNCSKNFAYSIASIYKIFHEPNLFSSQDGWIVQEQIPSHEIAESILDELIGFFDLSSNSENLEILSELNICNVEFKLGMVFILGYEGPHRAYHPIFLKVSHLYKLGNRARIFGNVLRVRSYDFKNCTYQIEDIHQIEELSLDHLAWHESVIYLEKEQLVYQDFHSKSAYHNNQPMSFVC